MNPFHNNPDQNPDQLPNQNDLIAFHLHELSPLQERALRRALQNNTALAFESVAIAETLNAFPKDEPALLIDAAVLDRNWLVLRPSLALHFPQPSATLFSFRKWAIPSLAASALAATALFLTLHHPQTSTTTVATIKAPASTIPTLSPSTISTTSPSSDINLAPSTPHPWTLNPAPTSFADSMPTARHATSAPPEAPSPNTSPTVRTSAPPTPPSPTQPGPAVNHSAASTATITPPSPSTRPTPVSTARHTSPALHHAHPIDVSLAMFGDFTVNQSFTSTNAILGAGSNTQIVTTAVGALASVHQQFRRWVGYRVTTTYSRPTFNYTFVSKTRDLSASGNINSSIYELSGTYVVQGPHRRRISTTAEAGASLLAFLPQQQELSNYTLRPAAVAGIGAEYAVTKRFSLRAEYRAQVYKAPNFPNADSSIPVTTNTTFTGNPILGFSYRLGATGND
jgi:hypothetical protein